MSDMKTIDTSHGCPQGYWWCGSGGEVCEWCADNPLGALTETWRKLRQITTEDDAGFRRALSDDHEQAVMNLERRIYALLEVATELDDYNGRSAA